MKWSVSKWLLFSLINLLLVALMGTLMRYKIVYAFPWLSQKSLQHAHSHFAFSGWVSQTLFVFIIALLAPALAESRHKLYHKLLLANLIISYGMLISFGVQGYGLYSIFCAVLSLIIQFTLMVCLLRDLNRVRHVRQVQWFRAALWFNALSSLGTIALMGMMASKHIPQHPYLASVYWYLHFQYNGWFFFAGMGLFVQFLADRVQKEVPIWVYRLFVWSCLPAYGLSVLWLNLPLALYLPVIAAALAQMLGWFILLRFVWQIRGLLHENLGVILRYALAYLGAALSIKLALQLGSVIPAMSQLAFGFRPIVIAYLHLVLLAIISAGLLVYGYALGHLHNTRLMRAGMIIFAAGVLWNEFLLAVQGVYSFNYIMVPGTNQMLIAASGLICLSLALQIVAQSSAGNAEVNILNPTER